MKFIGIIEADSLSPIMSYIPILGLGVMSDGKFCMGQITGDIMDLASSGHVTTGYRGDFKEWINELKSKFPVGSFPDNYRMEVCTYKEACNKVLNLYEPMEYLEIKTEKGPIIKYDLTLMRNRLKKIIESQ